MAMLSDTFGADGQQSQPTADDEWLRVLEHNIRLMQATGYQPGARESSNVVTGTPETATTLPERLRVFLQGLPSSAFSGATPEQIMRAMPRHWPQK